jgi:hypothetical protein
MKYEDKIAWVLAYLEGTVGSVKVYSREELLDKMRRLIEFIKSDAPFPSESSETTSSPAMSLRSGARP